MDKINKITTSKQTTMYDHLCKMIIGNEEVLSRIIKVVVDEAKHLSIEEIRRLIKGVHIGDLIVNPHFHLVDKEGFIKDEGMVYYDILCYIDVPQKDGKKIQQSLGTEQSYLVIDSFVFVYREIFQRIVKKVKERYWKFVF